MKSSIAQTKFGMLMMFFKDKAKYSQCISISQLIHYYFFVFNFILNLFYNIRRKILTNSTPLHFFFFLNIEICLNKNAMKHSFIYIFYCCHIFVQIFIFIFSFPSDDDFLDGFRPSQNGDRHNLANGLTITKAGIALLLFFFFFLLFFTKTTIMPKFVRQE